MSEQPNDTLLTLFKQALVGNSTIDYTQGSIARATFLLAVPMIIEMAMESIFAIVDIFFVSGVGTDAVATVGLTEAVITLLYALAMGLSMGTTALVARRIGEKNPAAATVTAAQALWLAAFMSLLVGISGILFGADILRLMGAEAEVVETGRTYTTIMFGSSFTIFFLFLNNAIFRGAGDASLAMRTLVLANVINIVLDPCLIYGVGPFPELGVTGAAVATNIGRGCGVMVGLVYLCTGNNRICLLWSHTAMQARVLWTILRISFGGVAQMLIATASWVFLMRIVSEFGGSAVAGYTIAVRIMLFIILPAFGLSNATATLVGQNLGANLPDRAEATVWKVMQYVSVYMLATALAALIFNEWLIALFSTEPEVMEYGVACLQIFSFGLLFFGLSGTAVQAFNGAGDTMTPTWINFFAFWIVQVPLAYALALFGGLGPEGVFWAVFVSDVLAGILGVLFFRRGRWKNKRV
ncbi:MAG: MATE family efflux transporter [Gammaproteobacteria bacterium]|nr:MATE family efflux transporter [Pseudomonadales bacterium]MCP5345807.1 MATE family efflux transporter [Pseudomonadales bacterium]